MKHFLWAALVLLTLAPAQACDCGKQDVRGGPAEVGDLPGKITWQQSHEQPGWYLLYLDDQHIGSWDSTTDQYFPRAGDGFQPATKPPFPPPVARGCKCCPDCPCGRVCRCGPYRHCCTRCPCGRTSAPTEGEEKPVFGVEPDKVKEGGPTLNGQPITRQQLFSLLRAGAGSVPADKDLPRLTIIGAEADAAQVLHDLQTHPELAGRKMVVQTFPPAAWQLAAGYVTTGKPTIYYQSPAGKVLHRQDDYDGPESLAAALREADPAYDPSADPDKRKSSGLDLQTLLKKAEDVPPVAWVAGAVAVYLLFRKEEKTS